MVTTPTPWQTSVQVNTTSLGFQGQHKILGLSNGNYLVVFSDDSGTVGGGAGRDIVGVIYDALGNIERPAFQVNVGRNAHAEELPSIDATNDGGFIMVYEDRDVNGQSLYAERFNLNGTRTDQIVVQNDPGAAFVSRPSVAVNQNDNSFLVSYRFDNGNTETINTKKFDANLNYVSPGTPANGIIARSDDTPASFEGPGQNNFETIALNNGRFVTVYDENDTSQGIEFRVTNASGSNGISRNVGTTGTDAVTDTDAQVAALTGGGFVIVWVQDEGANDNILAQRYSSTGSAVGGQITVIDSGNNYIQPDVIGLEDGGFFVVARDSTSNALEGTRFSSSGAQIGTNMFTMETSNTPVNPELSLSSDGRILVAWTDSLGNIRKEVWDSREPIIVADGDEGQITARATDNTTIVGSSSNEEIFGRNGNDNIQGGFGNDELSGGSGIDTVNYSYSNPPPPPIIALGGTRTIDLNAGTSQFSSFGLGGPVITDIDTLSSFENVIGSGWRDIITGTSGSNVLSGGNGNDDIRGLSGSDTLNGGAGNDILRGGSGTDTINGNSGNDTIIHAQGESIDNVNGGTGSDTIDMSAVTGNGTTANLVTNAYTGTGGSRSAFSVENFVGTQLADSITGDGGVNRLEGEGGNDTLNGGFGGDILNGGAGVDTASYLGALFGVNVDVSNAAGNTGDAAGDSYISIENLQGSNSDDELFINSGANTVSGLNGDDVLRTGVGNDFLFGGNQNDVLRGGAGSDVLNGGIGIDMADYADAGPGLIVDLQTPGNNTGDASGDSYFSIENIRGSLNSDGLRGNGANNEIFGLGGNDLIVGRGGNDTLNGNGGNDTLRGGSGADALNGGGGLDVADYSDVATSLLVDLQFSANNTGQAAGDTYSSIENLIATNANDNLRGDGGDNVIAGRGGNDFLSGRGGDDVLIGGSGNDVLRGDGGADQLIGGSGIDVADYRNVATGLLADLQFSANNTGGALGDTYVSIENLFGTGSDDSLRGNGLDNFILGGNGDDFLVGRSGVDTLIGNSGNDILRGGTGGDVLNGGSGQDRADYSDATFNVRADLQNSAVNVGAHALGDTYIGVEDIRGTNGFNDDLRGDGGANVLEGLAGNDILRGRGGNDTLAGGAGNDRLEGGSGNDVLIGGGGADVFVYTNPTQGVDSMIGFAVNSDMIHLDDAGFAALSAGALSAGNFRLGASAVDANDFLVYNGSTLFYDADANGAGAQVALATFNNGAALDHNDFLII